MNPLQVLVTGAAKGIGFETARLLGQRGATVFLGARDAHRGESSAGQLRAEGFDVRFVWLDVTDSASIRTAAGQVEAVSNHLDVLVNNAGILLDGEGDIFGLTPELLQRTLDTNLVGVLRVTQGFLPILRKSAAPRIVNVSSSAGQLHGEPQTWAPAYSISKTALNMLTQQLSGSLPDIAVNSMCPGWCRTDMGGMGAPLIPAEGADTVVWLATEAPRSLTGQFFRNRQPQPW